MAEVLMAELGTINKPHTELLVEDAKLQIVEGKGENAGRIFVRGEFGNATRPTLNKRLYPPSLWEAQISRLAPNLSKRKVLGELDHPEDGKTSLKRASHVVTALKLNKDGVVLGEAEILNTRMGKDLQEFLKANIPIGVSSRGYGSTKQDNKQEVEVVQDDYKLVTFDFVAEPADPHATPTVFYEHVESGEELEDSMGDESNKGKKARPKAAPGGGSGKDLSEGAGGDKNKDMAAKFAKRVLDARKEGAETTEAVLRNEFAEVLIAKLAEMKEALRKEVRDELMNDSEAAAARKVLDVLKGVLKEYAVPADAEALIAEKDAEIADLQEQLKSYEEELQKNEQVIASLARAAKEAGYRYQLEKLLAGDDDAAIIRSAVGDVTEYESVSELEERVNEIRETVFDSQALREEENARTAAQQRQLEERNTKLEQALEDALQVGKRAGLELYLERRLRNHSQADKIRAMFEHAEISSKEQIEDLLEAHRVSEREPEDLEDIRTRVRNRLRTTTREHRIDEDVRRGRPGDDNYNGLGASIYDLKRLAGIS